jgi:PAS domain S-box-containing protein
VQKHRSIFNQLLLLALWGAVPLTGLLAYIAIDDYRSHLTASTADLRVALDNTVERLRSFLSETAERARLLADAPELREPEERKRDEFLSRVAAFYPEFINLMWVDRAGMVRATARYRAALPPTSLLEQPLFRDLLARRGTVISRGIRGQITRRWVFDLVEPVAAGPGGEAGTFVLPVDLQTLAPRLLRWQKARGERVTVFDETGLILLDSHEPVRLIGSVYPAFARLRAGAAGDWLQHTLPGIADALPVSALVAAVPGTPWFVAAHLPTRDVVDEPRARLLRNHTVTALIFVGLMVLLRRQTRVIVEPIRRLAETAQAQTQGRHETMAQLVGPSEIVATAEAFNQMVAARRTTEAAVRESEERLDLALRGADLGLWDWHLPSGRVTFNERWARMLEYEPHEIAPHVSAWERLLHPDDKAVVMAVLQRHLDGQTPAYETEHRLRTKSGRWVWVLDRGRVVERDAAGRPIRAAGTHQDITERKEAALKVEASENRYRLLFENMTAGFALHDVICDDAGRPTDYRYVEVNPAFERLTGLKARDMLGRTVRELIPGIEDVWIEKFGRVALTGESIAYRDYVQALNRYYDTFAFSPRRGQFAVVFTEVTDKELAEQALRDATRRYEALVNSIDGIVWEFDPARHRFTFVSPRAERLLGYPARQWLEEDNFWVNHLHPDDREWARDFVRKEIQERRDHELEYRMLAADGRTVWLHDIATVAVEGGVTARLRGVMFDITARKQAEQERQALERKIQETQKLESLGVLAGGIAHDFNNLLTGILGNADLAQLDLPAESPARESLAQIETAARRAADLCRQMLAYSGKGRFVVQRVDLNRIVSDLTHLLTISISKHAVLRLNLADRLPAIEADVTQVRQVMMNLVINASEALMEKSGVIAVTTGAVRVDAAYLRTTSFQPEPAPGDYVFLEVSDNGCGMDESTRTRIFDPFFTTKFAGRGLGLAAVLGIMRSHRGAIKIYSEPGRGSTFKLLFPAADGTAAELDPGSGQVSGWRGHGRVLIIDDEETIRTVSARMLERAGFTTETEGDPREAITRFERDPARFALVLLDLTMPHLNGEEVFRQLRVLRPDLRVLLMSGFNEQDAINRFTGKGLTGFVQKPLGYEVLIAAVRRALEPQ